MKKRLAFIASLVLAGSLLTVPFSVSANESLVGSGTLGEQDVRSSVLTMGDATFSFPVKYFVDRGFMTSSQKMNSTIKFVMDSTGAEVELSSSTTATAGNPYYVVNGETITFHTGKVSVINGDPCRIEVVQPQNLGGIVVNKTTVVLNYKLEVNGSAVGFVPVDAGSDYINWESSLGDITTIEPVMDVGLATPFSDVISKDNKWYIFFQSGEEGKWYYVDALELTKNSDGKWENIKGSVVDDITVSTSSDHIYSAVLPEGVTTCYYGFKNIHTGEWNIPYIAQLTISEDGKSASTSTVGYTSNMMKLYADSSLEGKQIKVYKKVNGEWVGQPIFIDAATKEANYSSKSMSKSGEYYVLDKGNTTSVTDANSVVTMYVPTLGEMKIEVFDPNKGTTAVYSQEFTVSNVLHSNDGQFIKPNVTVSYASSTLKVSGLSTDSNTFYALTTDKTTKPTEGFQNANSDGTISFNSVVNTNTYYLWKAEIVDGSAVISDEPVGSYTSSDFTSGSDSKVIVRYYADDTLQDAFVNTYSKTLRETPTDVSKWDFSSQGDAIVTTVPTPTDPKVTVTTPPKQTTTTTMDTTSSDTPNPEVTYDVTGDGKVNSADLLYLKRRLLFGTSEEGNYDVNGDGSVNVIDLMILKRYLLYGESAK